MLKNAHEAAQNSTSGDVSQLMALEDEPREKWATANL
jgi:hypothetical protein